MSSYNHTRKSLQSPVTANTLPGAVPTDCLSESPQMGEHPIHRQEEFRGLCQPTADKLPDDVLLEIFDFYLAYQNLDQWHKLVHVCRRWRNLVFASPCRLDLRLLCTKTRPVRAMLDIWPALPINIDVGWGEVWEARLDNIVAALEHPDRVRSILLYHVPGPHGELLTTAMQVRFPELTELRFWSRWELVLPDSFLGGSAPRLRAFWLTNVPFPAAPNLLVSASDLVDLRLDDIPHSGYIPPASMVTCLSSLNKLESLSLGFQSPQSCPNQPSPPPQSRVVLPALIEFAYEGMSKYSEDLVAHIDTPVLNQLHMRFLPDSIFYVRRLKEFIGRTKGLKPSKAAELRISSLSIRLDLQQPHSFRLGVECKLYHWEVSSESLALLFGQFSHFFSLVERLDLQLVYYLPTKNLMMSNHFLDFFRLFTATRSLYVHNDLAPFISPVLQELVGARATEVLPDLRDILLEGSVQSVFVQEVIQSFVDARRLSGQPVAVHYLEERKSG